MLSLFARSLSAVRQKLLSSDDIIGDLSKLPTDVIKSLLDTESVMIQKIKQAKAWVTEHPDNAPNIHGEKFSPILFMMDFLISCQEEEIIEYENPIDEVMLSDPVKDGCEFMFGHGPLMSEKCRRPVDKNQRCRFHNSPFFDGGDLSVEHYRGFYVTRCCESSDCDCV